MTKEELGNLTVEELNERIKNPQKYNTRMSDLLLISSFLKEMQLPEFKLIIEENKELKEILDIFKNAYQERVFWIEEECDEYTLNDGVSNGISLTQEQYKILKEWLEISKGAADDV